MTAPAHGTGDAKDATVDIAETDEQDAARAQGHAVQIADAKTAVERARQKVERAKADVTAAEDAVKQAQAELAQLEGN